MKNEIIIQGARTVQKKVMSAKMPPLLVSILAKNPTKDPVPPKTTKPQKINSLDIFSPSSFSTL